MDSLTHLGRILLLVGIFFLLLGGLILLGIRIPWLGNLPGDIVYQGKYFRFYFPLTTCLLLSALATFLVYLVRVFFGK